jgi:RIO-like serine/threonine protein kinase
MVKIVNHMPSEDIDYIIENEKKSFDDDGFKKIGSGSFSTVFSYKNYAIKHYDEEDCNNDGEILHKIGNNDFFPKLYFYNDYYMVVELIEGSTLSCFFYNDKDEVSYNPICEESIYKNLIPVLFKAGYLAHDIHDENIMINKEGRIVIIDVGLFKKHGHSSLKEYYRQSKKTELKCIIKYIKKTNNYIKRINTKKDAKNEYEKELKKELESSLKKYIGHPNALDILEFIKNDAFNILTSVK